MSSIMNYWSPAYAPASPRASNGDPLPPGCIWLLYRPYTSAPIYYMAWLPRCIYIAGYIHYFGLVRGMDIRPGICTFRQPYHVGTIIAIIS